MCVFSSPKTPKLPAPQPKDSAIEETADVRLDNVTLTATAKSEVVALRLAEYMVATNAGGSNVLTVKAATTPFTEVSTVAFTVGA